MKSENQSFTIWNILSAVKIIGAGGAQHWGPWWIDVKFFFNLIHNNLIIILYLISYKKL